MLIATDINNDVASGLTGLVIVVLFVLPALLGAILARHKTGGMIVGAVMGFLLSWLGVLVALLMPYRPRHRRR